MKGINAVLALAILNEVVNGFRVPDFEGTLGLSLHDARKLMSSVDNATRKLGANRKEIALTEKEAAFVRRALKCTLEELGQDEFQTRTGFTFEEGEAACSLLAE